MRPEQPKFTDHKDLDSYLSLNRYYNEAEKVFDKIDKVLKPLREEYIQLLYYLELKPYYQARLDVLTEIFKGLMPSEFGEIANGKTT